MIAKRFYRNRGTIWENDKSLSLGDVEDRLNELHGENERLKSDLAHTKVLLNHLQDKYSGLLKLVHGFNSDVE